MVSRHVLNMLEAGNKEVYCLSINPLVKINFMKHVICVVTIVLFITLSNSSFSQASVNINDCGLTYFYDLAGNRNMRAVVQCPGTSWKKEGEEVSPNQEEAKDSVVSEIVLTLLYPNPTQGDFRVTFNQELTDAWAVITDNTGKKMYETRASGKEIPMDISKFAAGVYYVTVYTSKKSYSKTVVKK